MNSAIVALRRILYGRPAGPGDRAPMTTYGSKPSSNRYEGNDLQTWVEPVDFGNLYQTYWRGNQLPGSHIQTAPHVWYANIGNSDQVAGWQRNSGLSSGNFGPQLGMQPTANLIARWHQLWAGSN